MVPEGFRKVPGRFSGRDCDIKKRRVPEDFRKVPGRFPGRAKTHKAPPQICCNPDRRAREKQQRGSRQKTPNTSPEIFRNISGRFPEDSRKSNPRQPPPGQQGLEIEKNMPRQRASICPNNATAKKRRFRKVSGKSPEDFPEE